MMWHHVSQQDLAHSFLLSSIWHYYVFICSFQIPEGYNSASGGESNLIEDVIREIFEKADLSKTGTLSQEDFVRMLQSNELGLFLSEEEILQIAGYFDK